MSEKLLIIDGSNFLFRAYHALPPLTNKKGQPTGAIRGVIVMFQKLIKEFTPNYVAVTFDAKGKSFRNDLYPDYKAHRPPMPDDLRVQIAPLLDIIDLLGLPRMILEDVEADDAIATLTTIAQKKGLAVIIASSDKDLAQLVKDQTVMYDGMKNQILDREAVFEKHGVYPELIRDYLALMGDKADNIPGIEGVGPKTAAKWLNEYGSLENLVANAEKITGKVGERLRAGLEILELSKVLTTLVTDAPLPYTLEELTPQEANTKLLRELYQELEFRALLKELDGQSPQSHFSRPPSSKDSTKPAPASNIFSLAPTWVAPRKPDFQHYHCINNEQTLNTLIARCHAAQHLSLDTETDSLNFMQAKLVGLSLSIAIGEAYYLPLQHSVLDGIDQLPLDKALTLLKPLFEDPNVHKVGQNIKYDWHILRRYGITLSGINDDTMLASYILNSSNKHNMDDLATTYLNQTTTTFEAIAGKGKNQQTFDQIDIETATHYAAEDADITLQLHHALMPQLRHTQQLMTLYKSIEVPLIPILAKMEHHGICVDAKHLQELSFELGERLTILEKEAYTLAGEEFNLSSAKQLGGILFDKLGLPVRKKTPTGQPSTNEEVLAELALDYPLPKLLLEYRELAKLKSTYTDSLINEIDPDTQRIHTSFNQALTSTGRLSSSKPNLQNIPIRTAEGRRIRQAFIAPEGTVLISADYSQIELRLMAHFSEDETLINAFHKDLDIHRATAAEVFDTPLEQVSAEQRRSAKAINFGLIYGMGAFGLARQLGISRGKAQEYISRYFSRYPTILTYMETAKEQARDLGYAQTLLGRRLYLPEINSPNGQRRAAAERVAINAPLQGTAADIIKQAMITVDQALQTANLEVKPLLQVHDELVLEAAIPHVPALKLLLESSMTEVINLKVPLKIAIGVGADWDDAH